MHKLTNRQSQKEVTKVVQPTDVYFQGPALDLSPLKEELKQLKESHLCADASHAEARQEIDHLKEKLKAFVIHPEVRQITNVKDVSKDVMEIVVDSRRQSKVDLMGHANHIVAIESKLKTQKIINIVLGSLVILTILIHLIK